MGGTSRRAWPQTSGKLRSSRGKVYYYLMRIRIRHFVADPTCHHLAVLIKYFSPLNNLQGELDPNSEYCSMQRNGSGNDSGCESGPGYYSYSGSQIQVSKRHRIRIRNTAHSSLLLLVLDLGSEIRKSEQGRKNTGFLY